jgi:hypothetical protein
MALSGTTLYIGGEMISLGPNQHGGIGALDTSSGGALDWNPYPTIPSGNAFVHALAVDGTTIYAGGYFSQIGGQPRNNIAALNSATGLATAWDPNATAGGYVETLLLQGTTMYAGGYFSQIGGQARSSIAALDSATGLATSWEQQLNGPVFMLANGGGTIYAGGLFANVNGRLHPFIADLDSQHTANTIQITTTASNDVTPTSATLTGTVTASDPGTAVAFEWGLHSGDYPTITLASPSPLGSTAPVVVSATLTGLRPNTTYYYRLTATSGIGRSAGAEQSFTTTGNTVFVPITLK